MKLKPQELEIVTFLLKHLLSGVAGAVTLGLGLLVLDVANLGTLVRESEHGLVAVVMIFFGLIVTFGGVAMGIGIMTLSDGHWPPGHDDGIDY
ncbi:MAG TPA: hypothetical protein VEB64_02290 [Azospirillaceae bacterium]|nr:hypothetical protein [Azospirillaceae bacterium]